MALGNVEDRKAVEHRLLTADQVAERLNVHKTTVYSWAAQGHLPCIVLAEGTRKRCIRFDPEELERWLKERRLDPIGG